MGENVSFVNLTQTEIALIKINLARVRATDEERRTFFDPDLIQRRFETWFAAIRSGEIQIPQSKEGDSLKIDLFPCTD